LLLLNDYFHSRSGLKWYDGNNMTAFIIIVTKYSAAL
jgi:hypothetical protein